MAQASTLPGGRTAVPYARRLVTDAERQLLGLQRNLVIEWITSGDAVDAARRYLRFHGVDDDPRDVCNEAWVRLTASLDRRTEPLPSVTSESDAAAYCSRVLDNLVRDRRRAASRRSSTSLDELGEIALPMTTGDASAPVLDRVMVEQLLLAVAARGPQMVRCAGCPAEVVVATALECLHMVLAGDEGGDRGRDWFDRVLHTALVRVDSSERSDRAQDQRKSRCGRCVTELLGTVMHEIIGGPDE